MDTGISVQERLVEMDSVIILGLGNILYGDEGFGVRVAEQVYRQYRFPKNVEIVDAGTQGYPLLAFVERATRLLLLDAVDFGLPPGSMIVKDNTGIPLYLSAHKMSLHQNSFSEVLALAQLKDCLPPEIALIGMQPVDLTYGHTLSLTGFHQLNPALHLVLNQLKQWGIIPQIQQNAEPFHAPSISLQHFGRTKLSAS